MHKLVKAYAIGAEAVLIQLNTALVHSDYSQCGSPIRIAFHDDRIEVPDLVNIGWARRQADNAEYLILRYDNGLEAPGWVLSDGTLRMMAF